ncbi:MAG: hypothetical protein WC979_00165 [Candidatus Pacearchaeota archaeon]|jgi:hypothetical protein|nr:hypothetical protein [Clostridia bacterium]
MAKKQDLKKKNIPLDNQAAFDAIVDAIENECEVQNKNIASLMDIFHKNLFEVEFITDELTEEQKSLLGKQVIAIEKHSVVFNLNIIDNLAGFDVFPLNLLLNIINKKTVFDIVIKFKNRTGDSISVMGYHKVSISRTDFFENDFAYDIPNNFGIKYQEDTILDVRAYIEYSDRTWNGIIIKE